MFNVSLDIAAHNGQIGVWVGADKLPEQLLILTLSWEYWNQGNERRGNWLNASYSLPE